MLIFSFLIKLVEITKESQIKRLESLKQGIEELQIILEAAAREGATKGGGRKVKKKKKRKNKTRRKKKIKRRKKTRRRRKLLRFKTL